MVFSSLMFIFIFLPIVLIGYFIINKLFKENTVFNNIYIIVTSIIFYYWGSSGKDISIILLLVICNYSFALVLRRLRSKIILLFGVLFNVLILFKFKYPNIIERIFKENSINFNIIIPIGISFLIFHCISYLVDTYKNENSRINGKNEIIEFINFTTYLLYFPKLVQGPIVLYRDMVGKLNKRSVKFEDVISGIERFIIGLSKKVIIADELGHILAVIYNLKNLDAGTAVLAVILYAFQLYVDFSAYSDMAIGIARMMGFDFKNNFSFPYRSTSVSMFWRKWHISLGAFFKEYVYFPLGGSIKGFTYFNLFMVFLLTGIWHGNTRIYLYWGLMHGFFVIIEKTKILSFLKNGRCKIIGIIYTNIVVWLGWLCFRLPNGSSFLNYIKLMVNKNAVNSIYSWRFFLDVKTVIILVLCFIGSFILNEKILNRVKEIIEKHFILLILKYAILLGLFFMSYANIISNGFAPFLYFQF